jgi:hypothetical protein
VSTTSTLKCQEREIAVSKIPNSVTWRIEKPDIPMLVRDYLVGNYPFEATVKWIGATMTGSVTLVPLSIDFFDEKNELISGHQALLFEFLQDFQRCDHWYMS